MLNLNNIEQSRIGQHGLEWTTTLHSAAPSLESARNALLARRFEDSAMLGWMQLPSDTSALEAALGLAQDLQAQHTDLVVLGIGGSSLGGIAVIEALKHPYRNLQKNGTGLRVHFVDNVDGDVIAALLDVQGTFV
jgi:glucose-6-phosphate isomerase